MCDKRVDCMPHLYGKEIPASDMPNSPTVPACEGDIETSKIGLRLPLS